MGGSAGAPIRVYFLVIALRAVKPLTVGLTHGAGWSGFGSWQTGGAGREPTTARAWKKLSFRLVVNANVPAAVVLAVPILFSAVRLAPAQTATFDPPRPVPPCSSLPVTTAPLFLARAFAVTVPGAVV